MNKSTEQKEALVLKGFNVEINKAHKSAHLLYLLTLEWLAEQQVNAEYIQLGRNFRVKNNEDFIVLSFTDSGKIWTFFQYLKNNI